MRSLLSRKLGSTLPVLGLLSYRYRLLIPKELCRSHLSMCLLALRQLRGESELLWSWCWRLSTKDLCLSHLFIMRPALANNINQVFGRFTFEFEKELDKALS